MKQNLESSVQIECINHGNVFGTGNWYTFYCSNCKTQVYGDQKKCSKCGAILQQFNREAKRSYVRT